MRKLSACLLSSVICLLTAVLCLLSSAPCLAEWHGSYLQFPPTTGASEYAADNALLEQGTNTHFACGVRFKASPNPTKTGHLVSKWGGVGDNTGFALGIHPAHRVWLDTYTNGANFSQVYSAAGTVNYGYSQTACIDMTQTGVTLFVDGNSHIGVVVGGALYPNNIYSLVIGDRHQGGQEYIGSIYEVWMAWSDTPIITADSNVTAWSVNPTSNPLPFDPAGVSRCFVWNEAGLQQVLVNGKWAGSEYATAGNVVYAGVTLAASNTPQGAFILNTSDATANAGWASVQASRLTLTDASGKKAHGYIGPAGTGETLGSEKITSWTNYASGPFAALTSAGANITSATVTVNLANGRAYTNNLGLASGKLYRYTHTFSMTHNATGSAFLGSAIASTGTQIGPINSGTTPFFADYFVAGVSTTYLNTNMTAWAATVPDTLTLEPSIKEVVTPPSTGCSIYSTTNFAENSWATVESGFDWNSASYTIQITPPPFDLASGTGKPTYNLWKPVSLMDRARGWWRHWRTGTVP